MSSSERNNLVLPPPDRTFQALVFDFDGTILDTETPVYESVVEMYVRYGLEAPTLSDWVASIGHTAQPFDVYDDVIAKADLALGRDDLVAERRARLREMVAELDYRPGIMAWLETAEAIGLPIAIASSSPIEWVQSNLAARDLTERFPVLSCAGNGVPGKPDPAVYRIVCEKLGVAPETAIAIEDSPTGALAAVDAGMFCIAVPGPMTRELDYSHADVVLASLAEADHATWLIS